MLPVAPPVEGREWLVPGPLSPAALDGRVVVVAFWSFGCEASLRAVERLQLLAEAWGDQVAVLAVHSPRFPYEDDPGRLRAAIARNRIELPVVHDPDYLTWNRYNPEGWPALAVVDRTGRVVGMVSGLDGFAVVAEVVAAELARPRRRAGSPPSEDGGSGRARPRPVASAIPPSLRARPVGHNLEELRRESTLWFPSALAVSPSGILAVADSGNDRLLVGGLDPDLRTLRPDVEITDIDNPTALAFGSDTVIYVVERGTGSVLQIDLERGTVDVVADEEFEAPTALLVDRDGSLVVADAGHDQLIRIIGCQGADVLMGPVAGSGLTGCRDGSADRAELAQPVALARTAAGIAFSDAASSNVRLLTDDGSVLTVTGNEFYDWGLVDGPAHRARLQRPGGLAAAEDGSLIIADTGNDRIRVLADRKIRTLGLAGLDQPTGLAVLPTGHLLIVDTGNHRLVMADPSGRTAWPLAVYPATMTSVWEDQPADVDN